MKKQPKYIGIMVGNLSQRKRVLQTRMPYATGLQIFSFVPSSIRWKSRTIVGMYATKQGYKLKEFPFPKVVYNRYYAAPRSLSRRLENAIGPNHCFNHVNHFDKQEIYDLLRNSNVHPYLPQTLPYTTPNCMDLLDHHQTVYLKPTMGNKGIGVYRLETLPTGHIHVSQHHVAPMLIIWNRGDLESGLKKLIGTQSYLVQQGISNLEFNQRNFDVRVLVQKGRTGSWGITNLISRVARSGYFNTSISEVTPASEKVLHALFPPEVVNHLLAAISEASIETAKAIEQRGGYHLGELSVDFVIDKDARPWIVEVNGDPMRSIYKRLPSHKDVYRNPLQYARLLLTK